MHIHFMKKNDSEYFVVVLGGFVAQGGGGIFAKILKKFK